MSDEKMFPVLGSGGESIPFWVVKEHEAQAKRNHDQTVDRLAERGGLSWYELYCVLQDIHWNEDPHPIGEPMIVDVYRSRVINLVQSAVDARESNRKTCPIRVECSKKCAWWCEFANDCAIPTIAGILADSSICRNNFFDSCD